MSAKTHLSSRVQGLKFMRRGAALAGADQDAPKAKEAPHAAESRPSADNDAGAASEEWVVPESKCVRVTRRAAETSNWDSWLVSVGSPDADATPGGRRKTFGKWGRAAAPATARTAYEEDDESSGDDSYESAASSPARKDTRDTQKPSRKFAKPPGASAPKKRSAAVAMKEDGRRKKHMKAHKR